MENSRLLEMPERGLLLERSGRPADTDHLIIYLEMCQSKPEPTAAAMVAAARAIPSSTASVNGWACDMAASGDLGTKAGTEWW